MRISPLVCLIAAWLALGGCNRAPENKDAVRQAIIEHLQKNSGIDPNIMQIEITSVSFGKDSARAMVSFRPKSAPEQGLQMAYLLENKGGRWTVKGRPQSSGGMPHSGAQIPPGMPGQQALPGTPGAAAGSALPPGHPAVRMSEPGEASSPLRAPKSAPGKQK